MEREPVNVTRGVQVGARRELGRDVDKLAPPDRTSGRPRRDVDRLARLALVVELDPAHQAGSGIVRRVSMR